MTSTENLLAHGTTASRNEEGLKKLVSELATLREEFWKDVSVVGAKEDLNVTLEKAGRVADFIELGELMARDALNRKESCGGHFHEGKCRYWRLCW